MLGFVNLNKPRGLTSHDCIANLRKVLGIKRIGHSGTLDPLAQGVLPIAVNQATRLLPYLPGGKAYKAVIKFGQSTTTDDREGEILQDCPCPWLTLEQVKAKLPLFIGRIEQVPPRYSAIKTGGQKLYNLARSGQVVDLPKRTVTIEAIEVLAWEPGIYPQLTVMITCGTGTYIRSIARDLGEILGTAAMLEDLERTFSNGFNLKDSINLTEVTPAAVIQPDRVLSHLKAVKLIPPEAKRWQQGQKIISTNSGDEVVRVYQEEHFLGVGKVNGGVLFPLVVLPERC